MNKSVLILLFLLLTWNSKLIGQEDVNRLISALLADTPIEEDLQELCDQIGGRITGSEANKKAVLWASNKFQQAKVLHSLLPFEMPVKWLPEETTVHISHPSISFHPIAVSKYMSPPGKYTGELIYIEDIEQISTTSRQNAKGNFILVPADLCLDISGLFAEYTFAKKVEDIALELEAQGIVFMSSRPQKLLYTFIGAAGVDNQLPQLIMAREDAKRCIRLIEEDLPLTISIDIKAMQSASFTSQNVIAEIKGSKWPEEVIVIGAHIDSWALGTGANDNGCNVAMMIDIARQLQALHIQPKRTIRIALWNGEEQGYFGSWAYTKKYEDELANHKMALSVDIGSGAITGFFTNGREEIIDDIDLVLKPVYALGPFTQINAPIVGTDNFDFMLQGVPNLVANHLPQVYGLNYHAQSDTYDKVDLHALKQNSAIIGALTLGLANADLDHHTWKQQSREEIQAIFDKNDLEFTMRMFNVWAPWINKERGRK